MLSVTSKKTDEQKKQDAIKRQIALLQAQLTGSESASSSSDTQVPLPGSPPRKRSCTNVLAPATPSPKKKRKTTHPAQATYVSSSSSTKSQASIAATSASRQRHPVKEIQYAKPAASTLVSRLASFQVGSSASASLESTRTSSFNDRPSASASVDISRVGSGEPTKAPARDERLAIVEDIEIGPAEHNPPADDPTFSTLEPNSGIYLSSRNIPYEDIDDYLRGRYYISPSRLYSIVRLQANKQGYDVPVDGDFVIIAVIAERGPVRTSRAPVTLGKDDDMPESDDEHADASGNRLGNNPSDFTKRKNRNDKKSGPPQRKGKYVNLKLVDFGSRVSSSATGGKAAIRGDACLSLLLFESEVAERVTGEDGKPEIFYRGGSKGAFEEMAKLKEGSVVALLNPKVLKPFQRANDAPHPQSNLLALTPESAKSILVIGHARDLGMCTVKKRDGKPCGAWTDKRTSGDVCEYHVQNAVQRSRAGRAEFSIGTSGMTNTTRRKPAYDPTRQWGLKPTASGSSGLRDDQGAATYVVAGHVVSSGSTRDLFVSENMGREGQAKAARRANAKEQEKSLEKLLGRDREGMQAVIRAREVGLGKNGKIKSEGKSKEKKQEEVVEKKTAYTATMVKHLGFDPVMRAPGREQIKVKKGDVLRKLEQLSASRTDIELGPRPGRKRTNVSAPSKPVIPRDSRDDDVSLSDEDIAAFDREMGRAAETTSDEDNSNPETEPPPGPPSIRSSSRASTVDRMVDLDDESDLEVEPLLVPATT